MPTYDRDHKPAEVPRTDGDRSTSDGNAEAGCDEHQRALDLLHRTPYGRVAVSMGALPFVTPARHVVVDGHVLLRLHSGFGYHRACDGNVVAYGADSLHVDGDHVWFIQFVGTSRLFSPTAAELRRFGGVPELADGVPYDPVYLRVEPQFVTVHHVEGVPPRQPAPYG